jgi:crotonobetainyl-CoA:carnitine CoA-transferase CaiB-like acyl-CoA transferase
VRERRRSTSVPDRAPATAGPLAGLRGLDFSGFIASSYCPMTVADLGADVIKVE